MIKVAAWKPTDLQWHYDCRYVIRFLERLRNLIFSNNSYYVPNYGLFSMTHKSCFEKQLFNSYNCRSIDFRLVSNVQLIRLLRILAFPMYIFKLWGGGGEFCKLESECFPGDFVVNIILGFQSRPMFELTFRRQTPPSSSRCCLSITINDNEAYRRNPRIYCQSLMHVNVFHALAFHFSLFLSTFSSSLAVSSLRTEWFLRSSKFKFRHWARYL